MHAYECLCERVCACVCVERAIVENAGCMGINSAMAAGAAASSSRLECVIRFYYFSDTLIVSRY